MDEWLHHPNCWGCGPRNEGGLGLVPTRGDDGAWHLTYTADPDHQGPVGRVHGGLLAVPMDCLSSWAAIADVRTRARADGREPDATVPLTGSYEVRLRAETPTGVPLRMTAIVGEVVGRKVPVHVDVRHEDAVTATFDAVYVEVPRQVLEESEDGHAARSGAGPS